MNLTQIRARRHQLSVSQQGLARAANVSLATLQNIEAMKGNPSLQTLIQVLEPLGLEISIVAQAYDWERLIAYGLPLMGGDKSAKPHDISLNDLGRELSLALFELKVRPDLRKQEALDGLLLGLKSHYPSRVKKLPSVVQRRADEIKLSGRLIKLRRLALARLATYL